LMPTYHGGLARAGKNKGMTPRVAKKEKKKPLTGRAKMRKQFNSSDTKLNRTKNKSGPMEQNNQFLLHATPGSWSPAKSIPLELWDYERKIEDPWHRRYYWDISHYQEKGQQWRRPILQTRKQAIDLALEDEQLPEYSHCDNLPILPFRVSSQRVLRSQALAF